MLGSSPWLEQLPMGWSNFIHSGTQWAISRKWLAGGRLGCEKIKNNGPSAEYLPWRYSLPPPSTDSGRIDTFYHTLYFNFRLIIRCSLYMDKEWKVADTRKCGLYSVWIIVVKLLYTTNTHIDEREREREKLRDWCFLAHLYLANTV